MVIVWICYIIQFGKKKINQDIPKKYCISDGICLYSDYYQFCFKAMFYMLCYYGDKGKFYWKDFLL
jgi:hypothetical protein